MKDIITTIERLLSGSSNFNKEFLDLSETVRFLGISKSTLYKMNHRKVLPFYKPNGSKKVYYKLTDLTTYITANKFFSKQELDEKTNQFFNDKKNSYV
ncbi:MAG TPA: DNA-binding protein [Flavobacterium sp.]|nr:DNA-binding protein [Flavobacterium sp.]